MVQGSKDPETTGNIEDSPNANSTLAPRKTVGQEPNVSLLERIKTLERALKAPNFSANDLGSQIARGVGEAISKVTQAGSEKRSRSPDGAPDKPEVDVISIEGTDDNHKQFCWELRRKYKNPNARPEDYWEHSKYPLVAKPNLRGNLYLAHLTPLSVSSKALGWLHNARENLEVKYFTHTNRSMKRSKKEALTIQSGIDAMGTTNFSVEEPWDEASNIKELMDGLWNIAAGTFQIRPWDWSPMVIGRVCHEVGFFSGCSNSKEQQKEVMEEFINEALFQTRTRLGQGNPPITYSEGMQIAEKVVGQKNGRVGELLRRNCVYSARFDLKTKDAEIESLKRQLEAARRDATNLRNQRNRGQQGQVSNYNTERGGLRGQGRGRGRGRGRGGGYQAGSDLEFESQRSKICLQFNRGNCIDSATCGLLHVCNRRVAAGQACNHPHKMSDHR